MDDQDSGLGDLIGAEAALWTVAWLFVIFACFFFVGATAGVIAVLAAVILSGWLVFRAINKADTT